MNYITIALLIASSGPTQYVRVTDQHSTGAVGNEFQSQWTSFAQLIKDADGIAPQESRYEHSQLESPFRHLPLKSLGLGLTYPDHQQETRLDKIVLFEKVVTPTRIIDPIPFRESLDYEAEVSLLLHRSEPGVFGYLVHNDLTDRMIQALNFDEKNPAPSFSLAKTFPSANAHGPLMLVGDESVWTKLKIDLRRNGKLVQTVNPSQNLMKPSAIHKLVFSSPLAKNHDWILIGTGTPGGTIFRSPTLAEKAWMFASSGFNMKRATKKWVNRFPFLQPNEKLEFSSELLGTYATTVR